MLLNLCESTPKLSQTINLLYMVYMLIKFNTQADEREAAIDALLGVSADASLDQGIFLCGRTIDTVVRKIR